MAKAPKTLAEVVAETDVMPRATDKQVRAAKKKAESAARVTEMVAEQAEPKRAGRRAADPIVKETIVAAETLDRRHEEPVKLAPVATARARLVKEIASRDGITMKEAAALIELAGDPAFLEASKDKQDKMADDISATYQGPMLALRQRLKEGRYQKAANGQPSCGDELAQTLGHLEPAEVIKACCIALDVTNPYTHLNVGQQSMNLRNRLRGALKKGEFGMGVVVEAVEEVMGERAPTEPGERK